MRPLFHPSVDDISVECILHALADPVRVAIFAKIVRAACAQTCHACLQVADFPVPKSTLSQHFKVLREAGLIFSERKGVEMHNTTRDDTHDRFGPLIEAIISAHAAQCDAKKKRRKASKTV